MDRTSDFIDGVRVPKESMYSSVAYSSFNSAQKSYYDAIINMKDKLDRMLPPERVSRFLAPQIRKRFWERLKGTQSVLDF